MHFRARSALRGMSQRRRNGGSHLWSHSLRGHVIPLFEGVMSERTSGTFVASSLGWGASLLVLLGLMARQIAQPRASAPNPQSANSKAALVSPFVPTDASKQDLTLELAPRLSLRFKNSEPPPYLRPIAAFVGVSVNDLCSRNRLPSDHSDVAGKSAAMTKDTPQTSGVTTKTPGAKAEPPIAPNNAKETEATTWVRRWGPQVLPYDPQFLIALVPDPERSHCAYRFDLWVEAIQRACAANDPNETYAVEVLNHYYLPWEYSGENASRGVHDPEKIPGVLVFRSIPTKKDEPKEDKPQKEDPVKMRIVFLVGDTPVAGIQQRALRTALDVLSWFETKRCQSGRKGQPEVRIVGPVYSGSQHSLQTALHDWWASLECAGEKHDLDWSIRVVSTGTELRLENFRRGHPMPNGQKFLESASHKLQDPKGIVSLTSTMVPEQTLIDRLLEYLQELHGTKPEIVIGHLREGGTAFGADAKSLANRRNCRWIDVPFPLHISLVDADRAQSSMRDAENAPQFTAFDRGLKLPISRSEGEADTIPQQDALLTPIYQDIVLTSALQALARQHPHYVLITTTDSRDKIFLASAVNRHCPNARIILAYSDQLYTHSEYARYLVGSLIASSYPLSPIQLQWPPDQGRQRLGQIDSFAEYNITAYFNAFAAQLNKPKAMLFYQSPLRAYASRLPDCLEGPDKTRPYAPSVWISQVGRNHADVLKIVKLDPREYKGVWPPENWPSKLLPEPLPVALSCPPPRRIWLICIGAALTALLVVVVYGRLIVDDLCRAFPEFTSDPADAPFPSRKLNLADQKRCARRAYMYFFCHVVGLATIGGVLVFLTRVELDRWFSQDRWDLVNVIVAAADLVFLGLLLWEFFYWVCDPTTRTELERVKTDYSESWLPQSDIGGLKLWAITFAFTAAGCLCGFTLAPDCGDQFTLARIVNAGSWNSPVIPLLLVASIVLSWCWLGVSRLRLLNNIDRQWDPLEVYDSRQLKSVLAKSGIGSQFWNVIKNHRDLSKSCSAWYERPFTWWRKRRFTAAPPNQMELIETDAAATDMASAHEDMASAHDNESQKLGPNWFLWLMSSIVVFGIWTAWPQWLPGADFWVVSALGLSIVACWILICLEAGRLWDFWRRLKRLHHAVARLPMQKVFAKLPDYFVKAYGDLLFVEPYRVESSPALVHQLQSVLKKRQKLRVKFPAQFPFEPSAIDDLHENKHGRRPGSYVRQYCLFALPELAVLWSERSTLEGYPNADPAAASSLPSHDTEPTQQKSADLTVRLVEDVEDPEDAEKREFIQAEERLLAMLLVAFFSQYRLQLRGVALFLGLAPIGLLGAVASFSLVPQRELMNTTALLALVCLAVLVTVFTGLNQDEFLSRVARTAQRRFALNPDSVWTFLILLLPLILAIASRLAGGDVVYEWFSSLFRAISSR